MQNQEILKQSNFYMTCFASLVAAVSTFQTVKTSIKMHRIKSQIRFVEEAEMLSPEEIVQEIKNHQRKFKEIKNEEGKVVGYSKKILLNGKVGAYGDPRNVFVSQVKSGIFSKKSIEMVNRITFGQEIFSNDKTDPSKGKYTINFNNMIGNSRVEQKKQFVLRDQNTEVVVSNYDKINYQKALEVINYTEKLRSLEFHQHLLTFGLIALKFIVQLFYKNLDSDSIRGISIGTRDMEVGIKIGTDIGVIGELVYNVVTGEMRIDHPQLIINQRLAYLNTLIGEYEELRKGRLITIGIMTVSSMYLARRLYLHLKKLDKLPAWVKKWTV